MPQIRTIREGHHCWFVTPVYRGSNARFAIEKEADGYRVFDLDMPDGSRDHIATEATLADAKRMCDNFLSQERTAADQAKGRRGRWATS